MFGGSIVALVTPFDRRGDLDRDTFERPPGFHLDEGTDAVVVGGTTGESPTLSGHELETMVRMAADKLADRIPVIAGSGTNSTRSSVATSKRVAAAGADACPVVTPYYNKPAQRGLVEHYAAVADAVDVPIIMYNVPGRTACDMLPDTVAELAEHPNFCGIKESTGDVARGQEIVNGTDDEFVVLSGDDGSASGLMAAGARGVISVTASVAPRLMHDMCEAATCGDEERAASLDAQLAELHEALFVEANPIPVKWALAEMGLIGPALRLPLTELDASYHDRLREALQAAGIEI